MHSAEAVAPRLGASSEWRRDAGWLITAAAVFLVPLLVVPNGLDPFRVPKELLLRTTGLLLLVVWAWRIFGRRERMPRRYALVLAAVTVWSLVAAAFASHKIHAAFALFWIFSGLLLFVTAFQALKQRSVLVVTLVALVPPLVNAIVAILEMSARWYPFPVENPLGRAIGLMGNANDLGALLAPAVILAMAIAVAVRRLRLVALLFAAVLAAGIVASQTLTSMIAVSAGVAVMFIVRSLRRGVIAAVVVVALAAGFAYSYAPVRNRIAAVTERVRTGRFDEAMSNRLTPWLVAWRMSVASPVVGVGPGGFAWSYFPFKIDAERRYYTLLGLDQIQPGYARYASTINYGEAHNEYLEVLAEAGWPALAILVAALLVIATGSHRMPVDDDRTKVARYLSAPFAVTSALSFAGGFPLQLAGSYVLLIFIAAICAAWARPR